MRRAVSGPGGNLSGRLGGPKWGWKFPQKNAPGRGRDDRQIYVKPQKTRPVFERGLGKPKKQAENARPARIPRIPRTISSKAHAPLGGLEGRRPRPDGVGNKLMGPSHGGAKGSRKFPHGFSFARKNYNRIPRKEKQFAASSGIFPDPPDEGQEAAGTEILHIQEEGGVRLF